ncbi:MAG: hypothetical protein JSR12_00845 [Bacteroidetes bacterium]|nr:hypothetical protein [Bacteroidota bacterium]
MKKSLITFLTIISLIQFSSCKQKSSLDDLAERMSKSEKVKEFVGYTITMAKDIANLKKDSSFNNHTKNLDSLQKNDSMFKVLMQSDEYRQNAIKMAMEIQEVNKLFPELAKLTQEEKTKVFQKVSALVVSKQSIN